MNTKTTYPATRRRSRATFTLATILAAATLTTLQGCLVTSGTTTRLEGQFVGSGTFNQIEPKVTTDKWLLATMGEPTSRTTIDDDGTQLWAWRYSRRVASRGGVFLIARTASDKQSQGGVFVELKDGIVQKTWRD